MDDKTETPENDWAPSGLEEASIIRLEGGASQEISGCAIPMPSTEIH